MPNSNPFLKPQFIVVGVILVALVALSAGLRRQTEKPSHASEKIENTEFDRMDTGSVRISKISAPSSVSSHGQSTANAAPTLTKQGERKVIVEDFDTALRRAEGDANITGKVFGSDRERAEKEMKRVSNEGGNPRDAKDDRGNRWSERWNRQKAIEGAKVMLYEDDPNTTHPALRTVATDKEGSFTITNINNANQRYILVAKADNFAPEAVFLSVNGEPRNVYVQLETGYSIRGKVLDSETSQGVSGAVVYQPNPHSDAFAVLGVTTTTATGEYFFPNVHPGTNLRTQAQADGYATAKERLKAPDSDSIIELNPGGASISGVTIDRLTGKPQGGARVWAKLDDDIAESVISKEDGSFTIKNLPGGDFDVYAVRGMKSETQKVELERRQEVKDISITLPAPLLVSGQVIDAAKRTPLQGIKVWYDSSKGAQSKRTNVDGRFSFETMALDEYSILIHEKGYLPVGDGKSTDSETITRKVPKNQASEELIIRLRHVPTLEGKIVTDTRRGNGTTPASDAEVKLAYMDGRDFFQLTTKSDAAGNYFFNMPKGEKGKGIVTASKNYMLDGKDVRVPRKKPVDLHLKRNFAMGRLLLTDESSLDGVRVSVNMWLPKNHSDSANAHRVKLTDATTMRGGMLFLGLPKDQNIELGFSMPDGVVINKDFKSNKLLNSRPIFVYDPVAGDIIADVSPRQGGNNRQGGKKGGGNGNNGGNRRPNNTNGNGTKQNSNKKPAGTNPAAKPKTQ